MPSEQIEEIFAKLSILEDEKAARENILKGWELRSTDVKKIGRPPGNHPKSD